MCGVEVVGPLRDGTRTGGWLGHDCHCEGINMVPGVGWVSKEWISPHKSKSV